MAWDHLNIDKVHVAYAVIGIFSAIFSLISLLVKEKLLIGEATVASIYGLIVGPHCLNFFSPTTWGNTDYITLEISRIVLDIQIFAVSVELPKKYMLKHYRSVFTLLASGMTIGWLIIGAFVYLLFPKLTFPESLLVASCFTATDPVLAAAVVGKGKFSKRVPTHLRDLLSAESGCNDGLAFPFIYLSFFLIAYEGNAGKIVKEWICVSILYECVFGTVLGVILGYSGRHAIKFAERKNLIDKESLLAFYIVLSLICAGVGSILGCDDLLISFAAGAAFAWDGWFAKKTEETHVSTVIDLLLNVSYFVYFGAIVPWEQFNDSSIGCDIWRLIILAIVVVFLRRIPVVLAFSKLIPDIKSWREAVFCGHFGPMGVGSIFGAILARTELKLLVSDEKTPLAKLPPPDSKHYLIIACIWPIITFMVVTSIIVHGSSAAVLTLRKHINTMSVTTSNTGENVGSTWISRLPGVQTEETFFFKKFFSNGTIIKESDQIETNGINQKPAGGVNIENKPEKKIRNLTREEYINANRPVVEQFYLGSKNNHVSSDEEQAIKHNLDEEKVNKKDDVEADNKEIIENDKVLDNNKDELNYKKRAFVYKVGNDMIIENEEGEIISKFYFSKKLK